ncbi:FMN-dependent NADH-azoreductase [Fretibacter rubidus]|uniref:FMN-dependent NADH-azoreductase n=1 Tax=Fretibacter rubidus TaxID=570162 RepID=UPI00352AB3B4
MPHRILRIDSSARYNQSKSRERADILLKHLSREDGDITVTVRDVAKGLPFVDHKWVSAKGVPEDDLSESQRETLALSYELIDEIKRNDTILITCPIYNYQIPASLKAWIDLVILPQRTVKMTDDGLVGMLNNKRAVILFASSGTEIGSDIDFASPYLIHILNFMGIKDVTILGGMEDVDADQLIKAYAA